jgi:HK97 family phage major capsid protein
MALKQLMLSKKIEQRKSALADLLQQEEPLKTRAAQLETALEEAATDEEIAAVDEEITKLDTDQAAFDEQKSALEGEIAELEGELEEINSKEPGNETRSSKTPVNSRNGGSKDMKTRTKFFGLDIEQRDSLLAREEVKEFLTRTREFIAQKRSVTGADLLIPEVLLDLIRDNISMTSKLVTKVLYKPVKGKARQNVNGTVPEAVWTEMIGALNELNIKFNQVEVDGYKVGGFVAVPNSTEQDSDIELATEILMQLSKGIGIALDKAILYGLGTKQPLGIVTRLAQTAKPSDYPDAAPTWADLHTTHVTKVSTTGLALFKSILTAFAVCKNTYSDGNKFFAMSSTTHAYLTGELLDVNAAGAIVSGMNNQMPVIGGDVIELDFMADGDIVGGYGDLYLLAERNGGALTSSEHAMCIEDMMVFKGYARYDGKPVIAEGFFAINIKNANAATTADFETDYANTELGTLAVTSVAGTNSGDTNIDFTGGESSGTTFGYKIAGKAASVKCGDPSTGYTTITTNADVTAATGKIITVVEFDAAGRAIKVGSAQVVAKS